MDAIKKMILAKDYTVQEILDNKKYIVDYFQREYRWGRENIEQMITDLTTSFLNDYRPNHKTKDVANYNSYYMGPIVLSDKGGVNSIIDGQQRITSLTLLLIYLYHATNGEMKSQIGGLIYSDSYGEMSFNIQVPEREKCLKSLFYEGEYTPTELDDESTKNMSNRYDDICNCFPQDQFSEDMLKAFVYWVKDKLILVKITAMSEDNAYTIFESMNNRGLSLSPSEMLKGFILSKFTDEAKRIFINESWKKDMQELFIYGQGADDLFFQAWMRSQFANTIRPSKAGSLNMDFENIGTRFHNWFKENYNKGLLSAAINGDIENFIESNYKFFLKNYLKIRAAELSFSKELEHIYYIKRWGIAPSLSYQLLLAPIIIGDTDEICMQKIETVAKYIDGFVVRRSANYKNFSASSIRYTMCTLTKEIRHKTIAELKEILSNNIAVIDEVFNFDNGLPRFRMHGMNKYFIKYLLSRITSYIDNGMGSGNTFELYMHNPNAKPFEVEHIWCDHFEQFTDEFTQKTDFDNVRNLIGALLLLPRGTNQSLNDMMYSEKMPHYVKDNILAKSLCKETYIKNPNFANFIKAQNITLCSHSQFKKCDIEKRCSDYAIIANKIWPLIL